MIIHRTAARIAFTKPHQPPPTSSASLPAGRESDTECADVATLK